MDFNVVIPWSRLVEKGEDILAEPTNDLRWQKLIYANDICPFNFVHILSLISFQSQC